MSSNTADSDLKFRPPNQFKITDRTRLEDWKKWQKSFRWYASEVNLNQRSHDVQLTTFKSLLGPEALEIYNTFSLLDIADVESVVQKFDEHFKPKVNLIKERFTLYKLYQKPGQSFQKYLETVTSQVDKCEFGSVRDDIILYKIVGGLASDDVRETLLSEVDLNCEKAVRMCQASAGSHLQNDEVTECVPKNVKLTKTQRVGLKKFNNFKENETEKRSLRSASEKQSNGGSSEGLGHNSILKSTTEQNEPPRKLRSSKREVKRPSVVSKSQTDNDGDQGEIESGKKHRQSATGGPKTRSFAAKPEGKLRGVCIKALKLKVLKMSHSRLSEKGEREFDSVREQSGSIEKPKSAAGVGSEETNFSKQPVSPQDQSGGVGKQEDVETENQHVEPITVITTDRVNPDKEIHLKAEDGTWDSGRIDPQNPKDQYDVSDCNNQQSAESGTQQEKQDGGQSGGDSEQTKHRSCELCGVEFTSERWLTSHRLNHVLEGQLDPGKGKNRIKTYPCSICGKVLATRSGRWKHRMTEHVPGKFFSCYYCGCRTKFKLRAHLKRHMKKLHSDHLGRQPRFLSCSECDYKTVVTTNLKRHMLRHIDGSTTQRGSHDDWHLQCSKCKVRFKYERSLKLHMLSHLQPEEREMQQETIVKGIYPCDVCNKVFDSPSKLKIHRLIHTGERPFQCKYCDYKAVQKAAMSVHEKLKHSKETPYICSVCGHGFKLQGGLKTHMTVHTGERPYACDVCNKRFKQHAHMVSHKKLHTGEKPYVCDICGHQWAQEGNLRAHMKIHKNQSGDPSQYSPPRKRKKKSKIIQFQQPLIESPVAVADQPLDSIEAAPTVIGPPPAMAHPVPPSAIPQWSEQVSTINPMECFQTLETPSPYPYPIHQASAQPAVGCKYFQQKPWQSEDAPQDQKHHTNQNHLLTVRPVSSIESEIQHPQVQ